MALKQILDTLDGLDEALKPHYKQLDNGKFVLDAEEPSALKSALERERENFKELEKRLKGIDLDEYSKLKEERTQREAEDAKKRGEWDKLEKNLKTQHEEERKKILAELEKVKQERLSSFVNSEIASTIASAKGIPELLEPVISRQVRAVEKDGKLHLEVIGKDGVARFKDGAKGGFTSPCSAGDWGGSPCESPHSALGAGTPFTLSDLVNEMRANETFGAAFNGSGSTGSGTPPPANQPNISTAKAQYDALMAKPSLNQVEQNTLVVLAAQLGETKS